MKTAMSSVPRPAADPMEAVTRFVAGFSHSLKSPMTGVRGYGELIGHEEDRARRAYWTQRMQGGIETLDLLIEGARRYQLPERVSPSSLPTPGLLDESWRIAVQITPGGRAKELRFRHEFDAQDTLQADAFYFRNLLVNLFQNAIDASPRGAELRVGRGAAGEILRIDDAGPGLGELRPSQIVEPFFTTRPDRAGLGLAVACEIARQHHMRIEWQQTEMGGLSVRIVQEQACKAEGVSSE